jgi:hypothetical protein
VDRAGRLIAATEPGGITMVRTAFEIAFANWNLGEKERASPQRVSETQGKEAKSATERQ